jgi:carnitine O-acetyltransferase
MIPELSIALRFAESHLADLLHQHEFQVLDFSGYGKNFITSMGFSPDAFVQMAFQAAYYGLYGRIENTYEPAMTKIYLHGRTEAIRTVTRETVEFVKTFWGDNPPEEKVAALRKATERHTALTKECSKAQGQDRHLYALYCVWQRSLDDEPSMNGSVDGYTSPADNLSIVGSPKLSSTSSEDGLSSNSSVRLRPLPATPAIFNDAGWDKINNTILSTSNCGNPALRHFGFGPTSGDGFGIGYIIKDDSISICASSKHRQTCRLMDTLESYLLEIRKLTRATSRKTTSPRTSRAREMELLSERLENRRGRLIRQDISHGRGTETPTTDSGEVEDDGMGGCKFIFFSVDNISTNSVSRWFL